MSDNLGMKEVAEGGVHLLAAGVAGLGPEVAVDAEIVDDGLGLTASDGGKGGAADAKLRTYFTIGDVQQ